MPANPNNKSIKDFFKPFTIPKSRIPVNDVVEDEIVVASPTKRSSLKRASASPTRKRRSGRGSGSTVPSSSSSNASTPTKRSPAKTPRKRAQLDEMVDSSPPSQRREMKAVEIPMSKPELPPPPPPPPPQTATTSFSSTSTLSSAAISSQTSSRRIVKGGLQAVTNSDSGSEDSSSASEDELADVSTFIVRKKRKITPPPGKDAEHAIEIPSTVKPARQSSRLWDKDKRSSRGGTPRSPPKRAPTYKFSLANMIKQQQRDEKSEVRIQEADAAFEEGRRKREHLRMEEDRAGAGFKAAVADDSDEGERMKLALARTEALQDEEKLYYFLGVQEEIKEESEEFPESLDPPWSKLFGDKDSRTHAFLSGFVAQLTQHKPLPNDLYNWIVAQLPMEAHADLCEAYVEVLRQYAEHATSFSPPYDAQQLSYFYQLSDVHPAEMRNRSRKTLRHDGVSTLDGPPSGLQYVLAALQNPCVFSVPMISPIADTIASLLTAGIDENIAKDTALSSRVYDCIEHLINLYWEEPQFAEFCELIQDSFFRHKLSLQLRSRAIASLPAISERSHRLRRLLALHIIANLTDDHNFIYDPAATSWTQTILTRLKKAPDLQISESTNYATLNALIAVLDIAIDAGFTNPTVDEAPFNTSIDALASQLRAMASRIRDAGTTHLRRAEAKAALERLVVRLEVSVRTKPKPRKGVFGGGAVQERMFLSGFLRQGKEESVDAVAGADLGDG